MPSVEVATIIQEKFRNNHLYFNHHLTILLVNLSKPALSFILLLTSFGHALSQGRYDSLISVDSLKQKRVMCYPMPDGSTLVYSKPKYVGFVTQLPKTFSAAGKFTFRKESIPALSVVALSTAIFIAFDQPLLDDAQKFGRYIHLNSRNDYKTLVSFKLGSTRVPVYEAPRNLNSAFYSIGEGFTSLALSGGLYVYGQIKHDYRTIQTASQILQTQLAIGVTTQIIKRITGRESPSRATAPGGVWRAFPSFKEFGNRKSKYDAMPSGHMTTMMGTVTVLTLNYPEKKWIKPVGYGIMALVGFAMMNNDVHWVGDYPLAIGIGYVSAQSTVRLNRWIRNEH